MKRFFTLLLLFGVCALPPSLKAGPVGVAVHDSTVASGTTIYIPVRIDSSVTDSNVVSYQFDLSYSSSVMLIDSVILSGSMTATWNTTYHLSPGRITVAAAGGTPLIGTGTLVFLRAKMFVFYYQNYGSLTFNSALLNEGRPATVTRNGNFVLTASPVITVYPDNVLLTVGDTQQFSVSGGTSPFTWSTTDASVAGIDNAGVLTALHAGFCRVVAIDQNNVIDTSLQVEVRAYKLSIRDTSFLQGETFLLPVYITDLSLVDVYSGTFTLTFNQTILSALGTSQTGTLLASYPAPTVHTTANSITIGFAGTTRLNGTGNSVLLYVQFKVSDVNPYATYVQFSNIMMNESITGTNRDGYFSVIPHPVLSVSPGTATLVYGDSLQFGVGGGAVPPVQWTVSDTSRASISTGGLLKVKKGGSVVVSVTDSVGGYGTSSAITLYDFRVQVTDVSVAAGDTVLVPVRISPSQAAFSSFQFSLSFNQSVFTPLDVVSAGTLTEGWSVFPGYPSAGTMNIAGASPNAASGGGVLLNVRFISNPLAGNGGYGVSLVNPIFNEGSPVGLAANGTITVTPQTGVHEHGGIPKQFSLAQNYPNPFNPGTVIEYAVPVSGRVTLRVYNTLGQEVALLVNGAEQAGYKSVSFDASRLPSGLYFYRITVSQTDGASAAGAYMDVKKMVLIK